MRRLHANSLLFSILFTTLAVSPILSQAGESPTPRPTFVNEHSDLNQDNVVDAKDLLIFLQDWGKIAGSGLSVTINIPGLPLDARPMNLVRIPAGSFQMGSPDTERGRGLSEGPVHTVTLSNEFYMGETEVTQAQWQAIMGSNPASGPGVGNDYPVYNVSWNDISQADGFLDRLNALGQGTFRLPSEAEWEYACRAGTTTRFSFGDNLDCDDTCGACALADQSMWWCGNNSPNGTKPVAVKLPNAFGLFDMHGNLREWCQDYLHENYEGAPTNGTPWMLPTSGTHVVRGGYWGNNAWFCRSADRSGNFPGSRDGFVGFRVVLSSSPKSF